MICPRCATTMLKRENGTPYCYPCTESTPQEKIDAAVSTIDAIHGRLYSRSGPQTSLAPAAEAFRLLQERVAKLESQVADLKRRPEPPARPRFLGEIAEEPSAGGPRETR